MTMKKDYYLYLAMMIPIAVIIITVISTRITQVKLHPQYNFLYAIVDSNNTYRCGEEALQAIYPKNPAPQSLAQYNNASAACQNASFYIYNFNDDTSTPVSIERAKQLMLSDQRVHITSPDGFSVKQYCSSSNSPGWWGGNISGICLRKGDHQQRLTFKQISAHDNYYRFVFIGWILSNQSGTK